MLRDPCGAGLIRRVKSAYTVLAFILVLCRPAGGLFAFCETANNAESHGQLASVLN